MGISSVLLWIYSSINRQGRLHPSKIFPVVIAGVFLGFHFALFFSAVKLTTISNATLLGTTAPLFTLIVEIFIFKRRFPVITIFGILLAFFGVLIVQNFSFNFESSGTKGNSFALCGSLSIAFVFLIAERVRNSTPNIVYCRHLFLWASITLAFLSFLNNDLIFSFSKNDFLLFFVLAFFPSILGHVIFNYFIKHFPPSIVVSVPLGEPFIASIAAFFIFNEQASLSTIAGGVFTITGLLILGFKNQVEHFVPEKE